MIILSNDKPLVNISTNKTTSLLSMMKNLITAFSTTPLLQPVYVAVSLDQYLDHSLKIGHLPEYGYPVYCSWCGALIHNNGQVPDSHGICSKCRKEMEDQI